MTPPRPQGHPVRSLSDAEARGWGKGWPTSRWGDTAAMSVALPGEEVRVKLRNHALIAPLVQDVVETAVDVGYDLEPASCGGYVNRPMKRLDGTDSTTPSNHSWGLAFDLNWNRNAFKAGRLITDLPDEVVLRAFQLGFSWGGWWGGNNGTGAFDAMHFEFRLLPGDAERLVADLQAGQLGRGTVGRRGTGRAPGRELPREDPGPTGPSTVEQARRALGRLNGKIVAVERTASGQGAIAVGEDGGVFCWGDAWFVASLADVQLAAPIVDLAISPGGRGYWLLGLDGGVFCFGDALPGDDGLGNLSPVGQPYWAGRQGRTIDRFPGGYVITATSGETYHFYVGGIPAGRGRRRTVRGASRGPTR